MSNQDAYVNHGLLVIDKDSGMTSRDVVDHAQRWFPRRTRIGHTGTLDPLATGALVLCIGNATRLTEYVQRMVKVYRTTAILGAASDTDDADGRITPIGSARVPERSEIEERLAEFLGEIEQVPPAYSAAKVSGRRAHQLARKGEDVALDARTVRIDRLEALRYEWPELDLEIECGKGTYVRSLVRDLGERLGCGGYVQTLRRARIGSFTAEQGLSVLDDRDAARRALLPMVLALQELPKVPLGDDAIRRICHGNAVTLPELDLDGECAILDQRARLIAVGAAQSAKRLITPVKVLGNV